MSLTEDTLKDQLLPAYFMLLGSISSYSQANKPQGLRALVQFITHLSFLEEWGTGDIALLQLALLVTFSDLILPVCLSKPRDPLDHHTWYWATSWGNIRTGLDLGHLYHKYVSIPSQEPNILQDQKDICGVSQHLWNNDPYEWTAQFGELSSMPSIWNLQAYYNRYQVERIFLSHGYVGGSSSDIALLKLSTSVSYNKYIQPICVLANNYEFENRTDCWVTGWGDIKEDQGLPSPYILQEVEVGIINTTMCNHLFSLPSFRHDIWGDMVCAGDPQGDKDACFGDSGGPLACEKKGVWYQIGIVSWGVGCGRPNRPGVYTNVSSHYEWIRMVMVKNSIHRPDLSPPLMLLLPLLWAPPFLPLA
nr:testisin [Vicugna pacos]